MLTVPPNVGNAPISRPSDAAKRASALCHEPTFIGTLDVQRAYQELLQERERWRREGAKRLGKLAAEQIEQAYRDLVAAVEVVAERRDIDLVFRFIPTGNDFDAQSPAQDKYIDYADASHFGMPPSGRQRALQIVVKWMNERFPGR